MAGRHCPMHVDAAPEAGTVHRQWPRGHRVSDAADENQEAISYAMFDRRGELMARIFDTPAAGLAGLAVQARLFLAEHEVKFEAGEGEGKLDFSRIGAVLAHGILALADPVAGRAR